MNDVVICPGPGDMGYGCKCGKRFPTKKTADQHAADQNLIEENEAKAAAAHVTEPGSAEQIAQTQIDNNKDEPQPTPAASEKPGETNPEVAPPAAPEPKEPEKSQTPAPVPTPEAPALSPSNLPLDLENLSLNQINFIGQTMAKSGMFPDVNDAAKALVKILAGKEIGVTPFQAMTNIHIIQGKATMGANFMAAKVKGSGKYDYRVMELTSETCSILFRQRDSLAEGGWADLGKFTYSLEDAKRAGLVKTGSSWEKYPQNMLFARAISSGLRIYCPDVFNGNLVYVPEELGAQVNEDGEPVGKAA
jgi:hypothetical protein